MPLTGASDLPGEDLFESSFLPPRQLGHHGATPALPRFVPLDLESLPAAGNPWAIHSALGFLKLYLPEISISTGLVAASGVLGGRLFSHFAGGLPGWGILLAYLAIQTLCLLLAYGAAKGHPVTVVKGRVKNLLLGGFLILGTHFLAYSLLAAAK